MTEKHGASIVKVESRRGYFVSMEELNQYKSLFTTTSFNYLTMLKDNLTKLLENNADKEAAVNVHLAAHSLKSQCAFMGYSATANFAHEIEKIFYEVKEHGKVLEKQAIQLIVDSLKLLEDSLISIRDNDMEVDLHEQINKLQEITGIAL